VSEPGPTVLVGFQAHLSPGGPRSPCSTLCLLCPLLELLPPLYSLLPLSTNHGLWRVAL
jgi:hypothetical protein